MNININENYRRIIVAKYAFPRAKNVLTKNHIEYVNAPYEQNTIYINPSIIDRATEILNDNGIDYRINEEKDTMKLKFTEESTEMEVGKQIELEHIPTLEKIKTYYEINHEFPSEEMVAEWIANDHLNEFPDYYERLVPMELNAKNDQEVFAGDSAELLMKESINLKEATYNIGDKVLIGLYTNAVVTGKQVGNLIPVDVIDDDGRTHGTMTPNDSSLKKVSVQKRMDGSIIEFTEDTEIKHLGIILEKGERIKVIKAESLTESKLKEESEIEGSGEMPKETEQKIIDYVKTNPNLDDDQFHEFVQSLNIDPHEAEEVIYRVLNTNKQNEKVKRNNLKLRT